MLFLIIFILPSIVFGEMTEEAKTQIVQLHNNYRSMQGATNMFRIEWDDELAAKAESWANNCVYKHSGIGENIAMKKLPFPLTTEEYIKSAIDGWYSKKQLHTYGYVCHFTGSCHYTQMVWHDSKKIGCAYKKCSKLINAFLDAWWIVCEYDKPGNSPIDLEFKTGGPACSHRDCLRLTCQDGLCTDPEPLYLTQADPVPTVQAPYCKDDLSICKKWANNSLSEMTEEAKNQIVQLHNIYRSMQGANNMFRIEWDDELAAKDEGRVNNCAHRQLGIGENIAMKKYPFPFTTEEYIKNAIAGWYSEKQLHRYRYGCRITGSCNYTQMVWHDSRKIGCAYKKCSKSINVLLDTWWIVCEYKRPGNSPIDFEFETGGPACSHRDCRGLTCQDGLCTDPDLVILTQSDPVTTVQAPECKDDLSIYVRIGQIIA